MKKLDGIVIQRCGSMKCPSYFIPVPNLLFIFSIPACPKNQWNPGFWERQSHPGYWTFR